MIRRALWWLEKLGVVMRVSNEPLRFKVREAVRDYVLGLEHYVNGHHIVFRAGDHYYVASLRGSRVAVRHVSLKVVETVLQLLKQAPSLPFRPVDVARATSIKVELVTAALRVLKAKGLVKSGEGGYLYPAT